MNHNSCAIKEEANINSKCVTRLGHLLISHHLTCVLMSLLVHELSDRFSMLLPTPFSHLSARLSKFPTTFFKLMAQSFSHFTRISFVKDQAWLISRYFKDTFKYRIVTPSYFLGPWFQWSCFCFYPVLCKFRQIFPCLFFHHSVLVIFSYGKQLFTKIIFRFWFRFVSL